MALVILIVHLLVCVCLIGLVLLQRSEGGALGMGGGGGSGALMSGRGAADALARMTMVAGGFFLVTSFGLTILSGSASNLTNHSVFDSLPRNAPASAPATVPPTAPAQPTNTRPDPTESSAPQAVDRQLAAITPGPSPAAAAPIAPAVNNSSTHAAPITTRPPANNGATAVPASANSAAAATTRPPATTPARTPATTPPRSTSTTTAANTARPPRPLVLPNTSGSVGGIALTDDPPINPESSDGGVQVVRRERAGPDQ